MEKQYGDLGNDAEFAAAVVYSACFVRSAHGERTHGRLHALVGTSSGALRSVAMPRVPTTTVAPAAVSSAHAGAVYALSPDRDSDNARIITGGDDGLARVWNVASLLDERTDCAKKGAVVSLAAPVRSNRHGATPCVPEVNAARLASEKAWAACGDGVAVRWDINAQPATPVKSSRASASAAKHALAPLRSWRVDDSLASLLSLAPVDDVNTFAVGMDSAAVGLIDSRTANGIAARIGLKGATNVAPPVSALCTPALGSDWLYCGMGDGTVAVVSLAAQGVVARVNAWRGGGDDGAGGAVLSLVPDGNGAVLAAGDSSAVARVDAASGTAADALVGLASVSCCPNFALACDEKSGRVVVGGTNGRLAGFGALGEHVLTAHCL